MGRVLPPIVLALVVLAVPAGASARDPRPIPVANVRPVVLLWGGELFTGRAAFADWLRRRRESYHGWARLHPDGRAILARAGSPVLFRPSQLAPRRGPEAPLPPLSTTSPARRSLTLVLAVLAIVLVGIGALPLERMPQLRLSRAGVSVLGIAILVGVAVARLAG